MTTDRPTRLGIIGGSGLYALAALHDARWQSIATPWGAPSDAVLTGSLHGQPVVFLPRHGRGHRLLPHEINARANIAAMKMLGVTDLYSIGACGSFREAMQPGDFVCIDQFIDRTTGRARTFFGDGVVAHVSAAELCAARLGALAQDAARSPGIALHPAGTYICIDGPQFSTRAESRLYRSWGADVIGMTNLPEAYLAREAQLPYQAISMVTDYDAWRMDSAAVEPVDAMAVLKANVAHARALIEAIARSFPRTRGPCPSGADNALARSLITPQSDWPADQAQKLEQIFTNALG